MRDPKKNTNYSIITEAPGTGASREQISMLYTRYRFAAEFCQGKDVLEVACGTGQGLGYLARVAKKVVGGDIEDKNLVLAMSHCQGRPNIEVRRIDAHQLPFPEETFDIIILYEAIYYLTEPERFLTECRRVLRRDGALLICSVNKEWSDFNPSPFSHRYFSVSELTQLARGHHYRVRVLGAFPVNHTTLKAQLVSWIKQTAVTLHLIPKSMKGKQWLKRIFMGRLIALPSEICESMADYCPPQPISEESPCRRFKILYFLLHPIPTGL